jgi:hypothetical protein
VVELGQTYIRKIRLVGQVPDRLAIQWRIGSVLALTVLHPASLPPSAILCIRSLHDPRPGSLQLCRSDTRPSSEWERAVTASIEQLAREAVRPIDGTVPPNAAAVIFRDRSEFLACLAADWCAGDLLTHWWWQSFLSQGEITQAVIKAWLEAPEHIPMALQGLERKRLTVSFMQKLGEDHSHEMTNKLIRTYGLHQLLPLIERHTSLIAQGKSIHQTPMPPPWQAWIQDSNIEQLSPNLQLLLGVGLMLHRAPSTVRTASFARKVKDWQIFVNYFSLSESLSESHTSIKHAESFPTVNTEAIDTTSPKKIPSTKAETTITNKNVPLSHTDSATNEKCMDDPVSPSLTVATSESVSPSVEDRISPSKEKTLLDGNIEIGENGEEGSPEPWSPVDDPQMEFEIQSQFGGICYLINLGLYLELYCDFTTPLQPGIDLPIWDFVALIAQEIVGDAVTRDPIWSLLAQLADRAEDESPGLHFDPPGHNSLRAWLDELMLTVRPRLQAALGVGIEDLPRFFTQPAHIRVTPTRLDVHFALADLPIEIRLSGLDRDPGWVPAAGKFIGFHYE